MKLLLQDIAVWGAGGTPSRKNKGYFKGNISWVKTGELGQKYIYDTEEKITRNAIENSSAKVFPSGSVAIAMYGATIGKTSILRINAATNQACAVAQPYDFCNNEFLYYFLVANRGEFVSMGTGGAQPNISQALIKQYPINLPPLLEQKRIVAKIESLFSRLDNTKDSLERVRAEIKHYRQSVLKSAFTGELFPEFQYSDKCLSELISIRNERKNPQDVPNMQYIGMADVEGFTGIVSKCFFAREMKALSAYFKAGDILYGRLRPYLNKVVVANSEGVASTEFIIMTSNSGVVTEYVAWRLRANDFVDFAISLNSGDRPRVKFDQISLFSIKIPEKKEQIKIVQTIESRFEQAKMLEDAVEQGLERINQLKQSILKKAFEGKLVESDPNDEPVELLLERIKKDKIGSCKSGG